MSISKIIGILIIIYAIGALYTGILGYKIQCFHKQDNKLGLIIMILIWPYYIIYNIKAYNNIKIKRIANLAAEEVLKAMNKNTESSVEESTNSIINADTVYINAFDGSMGSNISIVTDDNTVNGECKEVNEIVI